ncbi:MAG TPA: hypothetical protein VFX74_02630, partial [Candidatus Limnocylindria bacterium]|nr:hypothetical protein [Candidatus Limnocylindria bacterium]
LGVTLGVISPGTGQMPYPWWHMLIGEVIVGALALMCPQRVIRAACAVLALAVLAFYITPQAVGTNIIRLEWLAAAPVAVACGDLRRLRVVRHIPLALPVFGLLAWPMADFGYQLAVAGEPTTSQTFYQPLIDQLHWRTATAGPAAAGERVEVIQSASQWSAAYVAAEFPLARGWDRQVDRADNPLFYNDSLTPARYHHWLSQLAVGWVALPRRGALDYAAKDEAALVRNHPAYLAQVWHNPDWSLYRVVGARPLVRGATVTAIGSDRLTLQTSKAGAARLQLRWSPYLSLLQDGQVVPTCIKARGPWTTVWLPGPGSYTLAARFSISRGSPASCQTQRSS